MVALVGPRQVGKTTLAIASAESAAEPSLYLELDSDLGKLRDAEDYLGRRAGMLTILDEVQRRAELFPLLRSLVDRRLRAGERGGQFLVLGSASRDLLRQSSESLAGRIEYLELAPLSLVEVASSGTREDMERLWLRGGFPPSWLADDEEASFTWRGQFLATYLERDIPQLGPRIPAEQMRRLLSMLTLSHGETLNASKLAGSIGLSGQTVRRYLDLLIDLQLLRELVPWAGNSRKRLVRAPKIYLRDSGLVHRIGGIADLEGLLGHPLCGHSWEGFAIEQLLVHLPDTWSTSFYRTSAGAEIDLVLEGPSSRIVAIEIKRSLSPTPRKGFALGCEDVGATERYVVMPHGEEHSLGSGTRAIALPEFVRRLIGTGTAES